MRKLFARMWKEDRGVLTFEWILLITVLTIGIVGGLSAVRDAIISELGDVAGAIVELEQTYLIKWPVVAFAHDAEVIDGAVGSDFKDVLCNLHGSCRPTSPPTYGMQFGEVGAGS